MEGWGLAGPVHGLLEVLTLGRETFLWTVLQGRTAAERGGIAARPGDRAFSPASGWPLRMEAAVLVEEQVRMLIFWKLVLWETDGKMETLTWVRKGDVGDMSRSPRPRRVAVAGSLLATHVDV